MYSWYLNIYLDATVLCLQSLLLALQTCLSIHYNQPTLILGMVDVLLMVILPWLLNLSSFVVNLILLLVHVLLFILP